MDEQWLAKIEAEHQPWGDPQRCQRCQDVVGVSDSSGVFDARQWPCAPYLLVAEVRRLQAFEREMMQQVAGLSVEFLGDGRVALVADDGIRLRPADGPSSP